MIDTGWGTWGFKASPICGVTMAELIATGKVPALIEPFALERFHPRHGRAREGRRGRLALAHRTAREPDA